MRTKKQSKKYTSDWNIERWWMDEHFNSFQRMVQLDMFVGRKNGAKNAELKATFEKFIRKFRSSCKCLWSEYENNRRISNGKRSI